MSETRAYFWELMDCLYRAQATYSEGHRVALQSGVDLAIDKIRRASLSSNKVIFVGNGGSAAIASHMAADYSKNGGIRAMALNDAAMLTCIGNDIGFSRIFAKQIEMHAQPDDLVVAISSSGRSENILRAVNAAREVGFDGDVITLSGFAPDNPLRTMGNVNFYVPSDRYGFVEIAHLTILHAILDSICGLKPSITSGAQQEPQAEIVP